MISCFSVIFSKQNENLRSTWSTRVLQLRDRLAEDTDSKSPTVELEICYPRPVEERVEWSLWKFYSFRPLASSPWRFYNIFGNGKAFFPLILHLCCPLLLLSLSICCQSPRFLPFLSSTCLFPLSPTPDSIILITFEGREHQVFHNQPLW